MCLINLLRSAQHGLARLSLIPLQPRYRRLLTIGALLDESIVLFREHWITLALFSLVALAPSWLLLFVIDLIARPVALSRPDLPSAQDWAVLFATTMLQGILGLLWSAASATAAACYLGGQRPTVRGVYARALRRLPALLVATLLLAVLVVLLTLASVVLFVATLAGILGSLVALVGLLYWWAKPEGRRRWLKWLIVLTAPFGLVTYWAVRWSLYLPAVVLEGEGPLGALGRSSRLVEQQWFRAAAVLTVASLILFVLVTVPLLLVGMLVGLLGVGGVLSLSSGPGSLITNSATLIFEVLFSSLGTIAYVLLFVDLRNRREGADLSERISSLEAAAVS
jgi:Membrane domain of glycerophosphoryl diester phosphodiesterase